MKPFLFDIMKNIIGDSKPQFIGEIGTHKGSTAAQLIKHLAPQVEQLTYYGYDLFDGDNPDRETHKKERNAKAPATLQMATMSLKKLQRNFSNIEYKLFKGFTNETLTAPIVFDFVYIDGGHSYETVKYDYSMVKDSKIIIFDDYKIPGVNQNIQEIIDQGLNVEIVRTPNKHTWAVIRN